MNRLMTLAAAVALLTVAVGCERKFTRQNFDMISVGNDEKFDVEKLIGPPRTIAGDDMWYYEDEDNHYNAIIHFEGETVSGKQWLDGGSGEWSGNNPHANPPPKGETRESRTRTRTIDD